MRDRGVCAACGTDTIALKKELYELTETSRSERLKNLSISDKEFKKSLWQADHIVPVVQGGGCSGLSNIQTLCTACHKAKTRERAK